MYYKPIDDLNATIHHDNGKVLTQRTIDDEINPIIIGIETAKGINIPPQTEYLIAVFDGHDNEIFTIVPKDRYSYDNTVFQADNMQLIANNENAVSGLFAHTYLVKAVG